VVESVRRGHSDRPEGHFLGVDVPLDTQYIGTVDVHEKVRAYPELELTCRRCVRNTDPDIRAGHETRVRGCVDSRF